MQDSTEIYNTDEEEFARFNSPGAESSAQDVGSKVVDVSEDDKPCFTP